MDLIQSLPATWKHDIDLVSTPGRDDRGDLIPGVTSRIPGCLLAINDVSDLNNLSSQPSVRGRVFIPRDVAVSSTDKIVTYSPAPIVGKWSVDGPAIHWPMGTEIRVEWEGADAE